MTTYELARCLVCSSAESDEILSAEDAKAEIEELWAYHARRLDPAVPPTNLMDRVAFSQRAPLRLVRCCDCGLVYRNPVERATELDAIYREDGPDGTVLRALHETQRSAYDAQAERLTEIFGRRGSGIEVGSYVGAFLAAARDAGWQFAGVDVNAGTNAFTRSLGFQVDDGTIESLDPERHVDVVAIWNCLDQLPDPAGAVRAARAHLSDGGMLALRVPNGACYAAFRPLLRGPFAGIAREWLARLSLSLRLHADRHRTLGRAERDARGAGRRRRARPDRRPVDETLGRARGTTRQARDRRRRTHLARRQAARALVRGVCPGRRDCGARLTVYGLQ